MTDAASSPRSLELRRANGERRVVEGYLFAEPPDDARLFAATEMPLPKRVDLRRDLSPVKDQAGTRSCAAQASAGAYEYLLKRLRGAAAPDVSRLFIYYNARLGFGGELTDFGASLRMVIAGLKGKGACAESVWPFVPGAVNQPPPPEAYAQAAGFVVDIEERVPTDERAWKEALARGYPIIFALNLFRSFSAFQRKGLVPSPTPEDRQGTASGHAMLCVGYSDTDGVFIVRNSWGSAWGDGGYCYVPYKYVMTWNLGDSWILRHVEPVEPDPSTWADDGVLAPDGRILATLSEDDYAAFVDALGEHPFELRLALLLLRCAGADGVLDDGERARLTDVLRVVIAERTGGLDDAEGILAEALRHVEDRELLGHTVKVFERHLPVEALRSIVGALRFVAGTGTELDPAEGRFIERLIAEWRAPG